ncbi:hypothetical protein PAPYR_1287 [Paratrimastix pyriformis]|uniref:Symplekin C-terminal domain-containing protein n=1 Tax=Paratrimastix pyriformis TaxID=342808 RepID=A0ABQ8UXK0_9EUKA|nr:hypothetical protein PAPYR_1287 [Paratrimastix pyriformis]
MDDQALRDLFSLTAIKARNLSQALRPNDLEALNYILYSTPHGIEFCSRALSTPEGARDFSSMISDIGVFAKNHPDLLSRLAEVMVPEVQQCIFTSYPDRCRIFGPALDTLIRSPDLFIDIMKSFLRVQWLGNYWNLVIDWFTGHLTALPPVVVDLLLACPACSVAHLQKIIAAGANKPENLLLAIRSLSPRRAVLTEAELQFFCTAMMGRPIEPSRLESNKAALTAFAQSPLAGPHASSLVLHPPPTAVCTGCPLGVGCDLNDFRLGFLL